MNHSNYFEFDKNPVISFLKGSEFAVIIKNVIHAEMGDVLRNTVEDQIQPLWKKLEEVENELKLLRYMNAKLVKKLRECDSTVDDSEIASLLSEVNIHSDSEEEGDQNTGKRVLGIVKWFNVKAGYGFVEIEGTEQEVFVHKSAISKKNPNKFGCSLEDGEAVEFSIKTSNKGIEAVNVTGPNGQPVKGSVHDPEKKHHKDRSRRYGKLRKGGGSQYSSNHSVNHQRSSSRCSSSLSGINNSSTTSSQQSLNTSGHSGRGSRRGNYRGGSRQTDNQRASSHNPRDGTRPDNGYPPTNSFPFPYGYSYQPQYSYPYQPGSNTGAYYQQNYTRN